MAEALTKIEDETAVPVPLLDLQELLNPERHHGAWPGMGMHVHLHGFSVTARMRLCKTLRHECIDALEPQTPGTGPMCHRKSLLPQC